MIGFKKNKTLRSFVSVLLAAMLLVCSCIISVRNIDAQATGVSDGIIRFEDDFERADGDVHGTKDWYSVWTGDAAKPSHKIEDGHLVLHDYSNGGDSYSSRPQSEATLNQKVSVDILNLDELANYATANVYLRFKASENHSKNSDYGYKVIVTNEYISLGRDGNLWDKATLSQGGERVNYSHNYDHKYRVEFSANGSNPTTLKATLYDITAGNKAVATVTGADSTAYLQSAGVAALGCTKNGAGQTVALYDNFKYEQTDDLVAYDKFERNDGAIGNDWVLGSAANATISSGKLLLKTNHPAYTYDPLIAETAILRPKSEATLNQVVSADFYSASTTANQATGIWADQGGAIIARCQGDTATNDNCYRLYVHMGCNGATYWQTPVYLYNSKGERIYQTYIYRGSNQKYRLELSVTSISETESKLGIKMYDLDDNGNVTATALDASVIDNDEKLQKEGTAGFSMLDRWGGTIAVDNFSYISLPDVDAEPEMPGGDTEEVSIPVKYEDEFDGENGEIHNVNGWVDQQYLLGGIGISKIEDGKLIMNNGDMKDRGSFTHKLLRPMSEASLNQKVSVDVLNFNEIEDVEIDLRIIAIASDSNNVSRQAFYGVTLGKGNMVISTKMSWGQGEIAGLEYNYKKGHDYRIVATAQGVLPTVITANVYDLTDDGKQVATLTARDQSTLTADKRSAQTLGTVGICYRGNAPAVLDNFVYEQIDENISYDNFDRKNGSVGNDWVIGNGSSKSAITSKELVLDNGGKDNIWAASLMRPMSEKAVEQYAAIEYSRPDAANNSATPVVFARAQTDKKVTIEGKDGFAGYYAEVTYTGPWSSNLSIYKVAADGTKTLLTSKSTSDYGKESKAKVQLVLTAQGTNPTKLDAMFFAVDSKVHVHIMAATVTDDQPELQTAGTAGLSYANSTSNKFAVDKFFYFKSPELPKNPDVPEDLDGEYMAYFTGTIAAGDFGQWVELEPGKEYIYSVRMKKVLNSGGFGITVRYNPYGWGRMYKGFEANSYISDLDNCMEYVEFEIPSDAHVLPNGKARIFICVHEGGLSSTGYATDFKVRAKDDPEDVNYIVNPDFKKGMYGWLGHGYYIQGAETGGVMKTLGSGEVELVKYDPLAFVRDDSDIYFDDGDWASKFETLDSTTETPNVIRGTLKDEDGNPLSGVTVRLDVDGFETVTDKNGNFKLEGMPADQYYLSIVLEDGTEYEFEEVLVVTEETDLELELVFDGDLSGEIGEAANQTVIRGKVVNWDGDPLKGVTVSLDIEGYETVTDSEGNFKFVGMPEDTYYISILLKDGTECEFDEAIYVAEGEDVEVELVYEGDESLLKKSSIPSTGDSTANKLTVIVMIFVLSLVACSVLYLKKKVKN